MRSSKSPLNELMRGGGVLTAKFRMRVFNVQCDYEDDTPFSPCCNEF